MESSKPSNTYKRPQETIYVDESGNTGTQAVEHNKKHPFFIIGFCYCKDPTILHRQLRRLLLKIQKKHLYPTGIKEIKFYPTHALEKQGYSYDEIKSCWEPHYPEIRDEMARIILDHFDGIFAGIQDKRIIDSACTSEELGNYIFKESLLQHILPNLDYSNVLSIIYDRGRLSPNRTKMFNQSMLNEDSHFSGPKRYSGSIGTFS